MVVGLFKPAVQLPCLQTRCKHKGIADTDSAGILPIGSAELHAIGFEGESQAPAKHCGG